MDWHTLLGIETARLLLLGGLMAYLAGKLLAPWLPPEPADRPLAVLLALWLTFTVVPLWLAQVHIFELMSLWLVLFILTLIGLLARTRAAGLTVAQLIARIERSLRWIEGRFRQVTAQGSWESIARPVPLNPDRLDGLSLEIPDVPEPLPTPAPVQSRAIRATPAARRWSPGTLALLLAGAAVLGAAAYLRTLDVWLHPGVPFGDAPVHLKWTQELKMNDLYGSGDGVYTKGMHAVISGLHLLLALDLPTLYRLWGPLSALLGVATAMWAAMRLSRSRWAGVISATLVGWLGAGELWDLKRQVGTLPQEVGQPWLLPTLWWSYRYLKEGDRRHFWLATGGVLLTAAGHWGNLAFLGLGLAALGLALLGQVPFRRTLRLAVASFVAVLVGEAHVIIGLLSGQPLGGNNPAYLLSATKVPEVPAVMTGIGVAALVLFLVSLHPRWRSWQSRLRWVLLMFLFWFGAWQIGRIGPNAGDVAIVVGAFTERGLSYLNLAAVLVVGIAFGMVEQALAGRAWGRLTVGAAGAALLVGAFTMLPPPVLHPGPRYLSDDMIMSVHDLSRSREPGYWVAVGNRNLLSLCVDRCLQQPDFLFVQALSRLPPGEAGLEAVAEQLGSPRLELLAFVSRHAQEPDGPRPPLDVSRFDGETLDLQDQWGAWDLAQLVADLQAAGRQPEMVWQGEELIIYRLWAGQGGETGG